MILAKDGDFAGGLGIDAQIRTKLRGQGGYTVTFGDVISRCEPVS
jgi:hypothetical protein